MKTYAVGGAVRDGLLGLPVQDRDFVVVGATPDQMIAAGYTPVGKDFPVFLHPQTHEEYALARTERKTAPGYKGFVFHTDADVTLEEDLIRRDLTINAMARAEDGSIIDPFNGQADLRARVFRHVSQAFAEDPVRILRLARFAARFADFTVAPETMRLMQDMVKAGEVDALVPERVWQELSRGLMEARPSRMFEVLRDCGALARLLPEFDAALLARAMPVIDRCAGPGYDLPQRLAIVTRGLAADAVDSICARLKIPGDCRDLAVMAAREYDDVARAAELQPEEMVRLLERCDTFRKPQRFKEMLMALHCYLGSRDEKSSPQIDCLQAALAAAQSVNAGQVAQANAGSPQGIGAAVHAARVEAVRLQQGR
ncbi:MAG TPA: multifunctional CCA tRNA nucleotidyl transferase/2'3'-cyclic phosphodiesterase/2'nucleotidase/phosphatase [Burkholderiaceae bacterium]